MENLSGTGKKKSINNNKNKTKSKVFSESLMSNQQIRAVRFQDENVQLNSFTLFFYKNVVFPAQAEYSYFSADFRLKIFLYYY